MNIKGAHSSHLLARKRDSERERERERKKIEQTFSKSRLPSHIYPNTTKDALAGFRSSLTAEQEGTVQEIGGAEPRKIRFIGQGTYAPRSEIARVMVVRTGCTRVTYIFL